MLLSLVLGLLLLVWQWSTWTGVKLLLLLLLLLLGRGGRRGPKSRWRGRRRGLVVFFGRRGAWRLLVSLTVVVDGATIAILLCRVLTLLRPFLALRGTHLALGALKRTV